MTIAWRNLFHGKEVTSESLAKAEELLEDLSGESPLYFRLATELKELKAMSKPRTKK
jgi:hypothetical protein